MSQGDYIVTMTFVAFVVFITARGELGTYIRLIV